jgi:nicotinate-nucleotide adenylyltransferase
MADLPVGGAGARPRRTVAVFGGSFDPPHVAHVLACVYVAETQAVDELRVVPTFRHPFDKSLTPFEDRVEMLRLALGFLGARVTISTIERDLATPDGAPSLTLATLEALAAREPEVAWRLVVGADILRERGKWHRWDAIERLAPPLVLGRQGYETPPELGRLVELPAISSTEVRTRLSRGEPADDLVPRRVLEYVSRRGLYRNP